MILALETATDVCSVAFRDDAGQMFEKRSETHGSHSENLFLFIQSLMQEHAFTVGDLSAVLVSEGPGSYTGLRIAASGVKGLLLGRDVPLYGVPTLASFACAALGDQTGGITIHSIIDARRKHVYHQAFSVREKHLAAISEVQVMPIKDLEMSLEDDDLLIGTGLDRFSPDITDRVRLAGREQLSARSLIQLYDQPEHDEFMHQVDPGAFDPHYHTSGQVY